MYHRAWSRLDAACFEATLEGFAAAYPLEHHVLVVDGSGAHTAKGLRIPENVTLFFFPPYSPEWNPTERLWQDARARLSAFFHDFESLYNALVSHFLSLSPAYVHSLTSYPYLRLGPRDQ